MCVSRGVWRLFQVVACIVFAALVFVLGGYVGKAVHYQQEHEWEWSWWHMGTSEEFWEWDSVFVVSGVLALTAVVLVLIFINLLFMGLYQGARWAVCEGCLRCRCCTWWWGGRHYHDDHDDVFDDLDARSMQPIPVPAVIVGGSRGKSGLKFR